MKILSYFRYAIFRSINLLLKMLVKIPYIPNIFKQLLVSSSMSYAGHHIRHKNHKKAYNELRHVVDFNLKIDDPYLSQTRYQIGYLYYEGLGTMLNKEAGLKYIKLAAEGGNEGAARKLKELVASNDYN